MKQGTCRLAECKFWDKKKGCPFQVETKWTPAANTPGDPFTIVDCSPLRTLLLLTDLSNRLLGVEQSVESMRNEAAWVQVVAEVIGKNTGIRLEEFVEERRRQMKVAELKQLKEKSE